jgi:hypothetical protein
MTVVDPISLSVRIRGVSGFVDSDWISLTDGIVVITGRNNAGKSRLLRTFASVSTSLDESLRDAPAEVQAWDGDSWFSLWMDERRSLREIRSKSHGGEESVGIWRRGAASWGLQFEPGPTVSQGWQGEKPPVLEDTSMPQKGEILHAVNRLIYLTPQRVIESSVPAAELSMPSPTGNDLGRTIYTHLNRITPAFDELQSVMQAMFPEIARILTVPDSDGRVRLSIRDKFRGGDVSIDRAGTGVSQVMHIIASVLFYHAGRIFLIDEPHAYLHPGVERLLADFLRAHPEHYYVCATHSPVFINAAAPEGTWLVTRDSLGTQVRSVFHERLNRVDIFAELGIRAGDVALTERVIFVEGPTEVEVLPVLLGLLGWNPDALNCAIVHMGTGDIANQVDKIADDLSHALGTRFMILLDGDKRTDHSGHRHVSYLEVPELEDIFLQEPAAVLAGLLEAREIEPPEGIELAEKNWSLSDIEEHFHNYRLKKKTDEKPCKASDMISSFAHRMGVAYSKPRHGLLIAGHLSPWAAEVLRPTFKAFFGSVEEATE